MWVFQSHREKKRLIIGVWTHVFRSHGRYHADQSNAPIGCLEIKQQHNLQHTSWVSCAYVYVFIQ
jgi:hypothetical protein